MTSATSTDWQFTIDLPEPWAVSDPTTTPDVALLAQSTTAGTAIKQASAFTAQYGPPDFVASLMQPVIDESGILIAILIATCTTYLYYTADLPGDVDEQTRTLRGVEISDGVVADFHELTVPVFSEDRSVVALLTFSTPNLPLADELASIFRAIVKTARVAPIGGGGERSSTTLPQGR